MTAADIIFVSFWQLVLTFLIALIIKALVNIGLQSIMHTLELLSVIVSIVMLKQGSTHWLISLVIMTIFWRYAFRVYADCHNDIISNKEKK